MSRISSFFVSKTPYLFVARYALSVIMMAYAVMKLNAMQFNAIIPVSAWGQTLEHISGSQLTWAFLGHSRWFQVLLGVFEFVPAVLLLFKRSALLGAILMLPMTLSVCLINYAMHLWYNTQRISLIMLLLNLLILLLEWSIVKKMFSMALGAAVSRKYFLVELLVALALISYSVLKKTSFADYGQREYNELTGDWFHRHGNEFVLVSECINSNPTGANDYIPRASRPGDSMLPLRDLRLYFGPWEMYSELNDSVNNKAGSKRYEIHEKDKVLHIDEKYRLTEQTIGNFLLPLGKFPLHTAQRQFNTATTCKG